MGGFVYMLHCADGSYYIGVASGHDLAKRVAEHEMGVYGGYTSTRRPVQLVWSQYFERIEDAIAAERKLKGWSRAKKAALIDSNWPRIAAWRNGEAEGHAVTSRTRHPEVLAQRASKGDGL